LEICITTGSRHIHQHQINKSHTYSGVVKVDVKVDNKSIFIIPFKNGSLSIILTHPGRRLVFDDKEIFHAEVSGPPLVSQPGLKIVL
jgi:hypothetical protein